MKKWYDEINLPDKISELINGKEGSIDRIGMSESTVIAYDDMVLKIEKFNEKTAETVSMMKWLDGKIPVPKVIAYETFDGKSYLLMSRIMGKMSCDKYYLEHPDELIELLVQGLKMLWNVDISDCNRVRDLETELQEARYRVENNLVDLERTEPETFGEGGFESPVQLLEWLEENKPACEPVLSHGDFCLPNIFLKNGKVSGFIDLGDTGIGDKWRDISLCYRSLKHNFDGTFGGMVYSDFDPDMLFEKLGVEKNNEKLRYYILLDELF